MFEQATLSTGPAGKRVWTTMLGVTSQVALVSFAALAPMVWPQVLPTARFLESLAPPLPPAPPPKPLGGDVKRPVTHAKIVRNTGWSTLFVEPRRVPTGPIPTIQDEPSGPVVVGVPEGFGRPDGVVGNIIQGLARNTALAVPPAIPKSKPAVPEASPVTPRYIVGGNVRLGALLHKAEPPYPQIARAAHVSGAVELECVVGVDGHISEVKVKSGNPLLVRAAVEAAWQWVYAPSKLNGVPIEIVTILTFTFKLN